MRSQNAYRPAPRARARARDCRARTRKEDPKTPARLGLGEGNGDARCLARTRTEGRSRGPGHPGRPGRQVSNPAEYFCQYGLDIKRAAASITFLWNSPTAASVTCPPRKPQRARRRLRNAPYRIQQPRDHRRQQIPDTGLELARQLKPAPLPQRSLARPLPRATNAIRQPAAAAQVAWRLTSRL